MTHGRVYVWAPDSTRLLGGYVSARVVPLPRLDAFGEAGATLQGRYAEVHNAGYIYEPDSRTGETRIVAIGDAKPNADGDFVFDPGRGGGRIDKQPLASETFRARYVQASHFGEVNTYYHLDRIAAYVDDLCQELDAPRLPRVRALVNAHHAATEHEGVRDGVWNGRRWRPFQGGHYRLPSKRYGAVQESAPISPDGEIHLGPGFKLLEYGALVEATGRKYRHNASHNAGTLYHEYGHHITRHTADFQMNAQRRPGSQKNRKTALDEGTCDYWTAALLGTPHIWAWHKRHDSQQIHCRSLNSPKTMADYVSNKSSAHSNGTIWAAALWDLRTRLAAVARDGERRTDLLLLQALFLLGQSVKDADLATRRSPGTEHTGMAAGLEALLRADDRLHAGRHRDLIRVTFTDRGICAESGTTGAVS